MKRYGISVSVLIITAFGLAAQEQEKPLQPGEFDVYNDAVKAINTNQFAAAITALDTWKQKFPDSAFQNERTAFYVQAYAAGGQAAKAVDAAGGLINGDLSHLFSGKAAQASVIRLLYNTSWAIANTPNPTAVEIATGEKAARLLMSYDQPLPDLSAEQWKQARADMQQKATTALVYIAMAPGIQAMAKAPPDCETAVAAYTKAAGDYPQRSAISYELGRAYICLAKSQPDKARFAVYEFIRAAVTDPTLGVAGKDPKQIQTYADNSYVRYHGSDEGLADLKKLVMDAALPPATFKLKSVTEIAEAKRAEFEDKNPQLALWMKIKGALSDTGGEQYFEDQLKGSGVPQLRGTLVEAKPACHPKELLVAVPLPDAAGAPKTEISLKLDKALSGKPEVNGEFHWEGVPSAFRRDPFLLTMDVDVDKLQGLKSAPCIAAPATTAKKK